MNLHIEVCTIYLIDVSPQLIHKELFLVLFFLPKIINIIYEWISMGDKVVNLLGSTRSKISLGKPSDFPSVGNKTR